MLRRQAPPNAFAPLALLILLTEIFSPFAFAQQVAPSSQTDSAAQTLSFQSSTPPLLGAGCELKTLSAAQYRQFIDSTFNFQGKEITDRQDTSLKALPAANAQNINQALSSSDDPDAATFMTAQEFANLAASGSRTPSQVLSDLKSNLGLNPTDEMTVAQAKNFATLKAYPQTLQGQLASLTSGRKATTAPSFDAMKVRLPNGIELALSDLNRIPAIKSSLTDQNSCLLQNQLYKGKLSYRGLLAQDFTIAADNAEAQKPLGQQSKQHVNTNSFSASEANYDGSVVIPRLYEMAVSQLKFWSLIDFLANGAIMLYSLKSLSTADDAVKFMEKDQAASKVTFAKFKRDVQSYVSSTEGTTISHAYQDAIVNKALKNGELQKMDLEKTALAGWGIPDTQVINDLPTLDEQLAYIQSKAVVPVATSGGKVPGALPGDFSEAVRTQAQANSLDDLASKAADFKSASGLAYSRAWSSFTLGLLWLGPARLGLELAGQLVFTSVGPSNGNLGTRVTIFANNNQFADAFDKGTDWLTSGKIFDAISDFTKSGIPTKLFHVDNVQLIASMGSTGKEAASTTTILPVQGGGWQIKPTWLGSSQFTAFEDVRDGKTTTSMAIEVNNTKIGVGFNHNKELATYYTEIGTFAVVFGWFFHKSTEISTLYTTAGPLIFLLRLAVLDSYIDNFVDPAKFSTDTRCSDETFNYYLNWYKGWVAGGAVETAVLTLWGGYIQSYLQQFTNTLARNALRGFDVYSKISIVDPVSIGKAYAGSKVLEYASTCQDTQYKILTYQNLPKSATPSALQTLKNKVNDPLGLQSITQGLNIGKAFSTTIGQQAPTANLQEILNFKALLDGQQGSVSPSELYSLHLDPTTEMHAADPYGAACFRNCQVDDKGNFVCLDGQRGVYDSKGNQIADRDFALTGYTIPRLGTVVPTRIITTPLACSNGPIMLASATDNSVNIVDTSCAAMQCTQNLLAQVTGFAGGTTLSTQNWLGNLRSVQTTVGVGPIYAGEFRFTYTSGVLSQSTTLGAVLDALPGISVPASQANPNQATPVPGGLTSTQSSLSGAERRFISIEIMGDGSVRIAGSGKPEDSLGQLAAMEFDKGSIFFDRQQQRLVVAARTFTEIPASSIKSIGASPGTADNGRKDLQDQLSSLGELRDKINSGQPLTQKDLDLLRQQLNAMANKSPLSDSDLALLRAALAKQASGQPLTPQERNIINTAGQLPIYPTFVPMPSSQIDRVLPLLQANGVQPAQSSAIQGKLQAGTPLSLADKQAINSAIDKGVAAGTISPTDASALKQSTTAATAPSENANEILQALQNGQPLSDSQRQALLNQIAASTVDTQNRLAATPAVDIPGIRLGPVIAKPGQEENAQRLNQALTQLGTLTDFKTANKVISFGTDSQGNQVVRIGDTATGTVSQLKITGPPTQQGNSIIFPTDKGPLSVSFSMNPTTGAPTINVDGPGIKESSPLLLAQGQNGFLWFDPVTGTWKSGPGVVIPTDQLFGKTGAQFQGSADGTRGFAAQDQFTPPTAYNNINGAGINSNPLLSLPSWPQEPAGILAMLLAILAGALAVRVLPQYQHKDKRHRK